MVRSNSLQTEIPSLNRREFLYYALGGSMVLAAGGAAAGLVRYMTPIDPTRFATLTNRDLQLSYSAQLYGYNRFYIDRDIDEMSVLRINCTYKGCIVKWVESAFRFWCPCCGSQFQIDGTYMDGPAPRGLDRYFIEITFADGSTATSNDAGDPIPLAGREIARVVVDTKRLILGPAR